MEEQQVSENTKTVKTNAMSVLRHLLKIPGVKVKRNTFLLEVFSNEVKTKADKMRLIEEGPVKLFGKEVIDSKAKKCITTTTNRASMMSFAAGLPGGFAILGTLPADTIQMYAMTLKMAQELSYLYGAEDIWENNHEVDSEAEDKLIVYLGVMLGVNTAASATRLFSNALTKVLIEQTTQQAVHQGITHQVAKKVLKTIGIKSSKKGISSGMAKLIPIAGGVFSGGLTYFGVKPMGNKLNEVLKESVFGYEEEQFVEDITQHGLNKEPLLLETFTTIEEDNIMTQDRIAAGERLNQKGLISKEELLKLKNKLLKKKND